MCMCVCVYTHMHTNMIQCVCLNREWKKTGNSFKLGDLVTYDLYLQKITID